MKYKILKYSNEYPTYDCYLCKNERGNKVYLDIFVDGSHNGFNVEKDRQEYVGRTIEVEDIFPYIPLYMAKNVKLLELEAK